MLRGDLLRLASWFSLWWAISFAAWWLFVGEFSGSELFMGVGLSLISAVSGTLLTRHGLVDGRTVGRWIRITPSVVRAVLVDFVLIFVRLVRAVRGGHRGSVGVLVRRPVDVADDLVPGVRSWLTVSATVSPNAYVIDIDPDRRQVLLHDLIERRSSERPA